jgi:hypothetical protein
LPRDAGLCALGPLQAPGESDLPDEAISLRLGCLEAKQRADFVIAKVEEFPHDLFRTQRIDNYN